MGDLCDGHIYSDFCDYLLEISMQKLGSGQEGRKTELLASGIFGFLWAPGCLSKGINLQRPQAGSSEVSSSLNVQ